MSKEDNEKKLEKMNKDRTDKASAKPKSKEEQYDDVKLVRILGKDIRGDKKTYVGLTRIKGISWALSNAICKKSGVSHDKRIQDLSPEELKKIESFIQSPDVPKFLKNRRKDFDTGDDKHVYGADLDLRKDFDIKRLKKIKSYKGWRHTAGQPVRGQRTKSHFRKDKKRSGAVGVRTKKK